MQQGPGLAAVLVLAGALSGCASGASAAGMTITMAELVKPANPAVERAFAVGAVGGGSETNPLWTSQVDDRTFREALTASLRLAGLLAEGGSRYTLKAALISLEQPLFGFDMTVTATVRYVVTDTAGGAEVWQETVATPFTATIGDAFMGPTRLKLANEGSMRKNIARVVERIGAAPLPGPVGVN